MSEQQDKWIGMLEAEWSEPEGFLSKVRAGKYDPQEGQEFVAKLSEIKLITGQALLPRFVSLLWYIPLFLSWQKERVSKKGGDTADFEQTANEVLTIVQDVLGVP